jgi:hypothetical protein
MTLAQALGIAAASLVFIEPQLPAHAYHQLEGLAGRLDAHVQARHAGHRLDMGAPPDSYCMKRGALLL